MITKEQMDDALSAWEVAMDRSILEQEAFGIATQSHGALIQSLRSHGHTWAKAEAEFQKISEAHRAALLAAWRAMDERCCEYRALLAKFKHQ